MHHCGHICARQFALYEGSSSMHGLAGYQDCSIVSTGFEVATDTYALALAKDSPYRLLFNQQMTRMKESGQLGKILTKYAKVKMNTLG